ncbi:centromere-associated protein E isoform X2 [Mastacembelus armatus]|uniref:centromere-associated protein E isoform X2 n=1 Tax=Mastacembelus armatus TaxID=205130 RepID=UPI000E456A41|nr:centromere-associated protein E isoform X2 [Mastacembelus armatus]
MMEESAVKVCLRVRPLIVREESAAIENAEPVQLFWRADKKSIHQVDDGNSTKSFSFDRVFTAEETTTQLYQEIAKPLVVSTVEGYNGTIFAYGQTSSGKTFTMMGGNHIPGVIPLAVEDVFKTIKNFPKKEFLLRVSYMEIYNETVTDLLVDSWKRKPLEVREAINKNIYVADLTEELVTSPAQALAWIRKGEKNRHYGKTKMNQRSSRSHTIFRMILESRERSDPGSGENADGAIIVSHLNLVDLAGSERASQTGAEGTRFKEGCNINRSLFTLGQVIKKLTDEGQKGFTNYRDSKLTRILQNSLGGNAKTVIICTITPITIDETLSTLQFASTAKKMKNDPHVTEVSDDGALLKRYRNEIVDLKRRLHEVTSVTQTTVTEKEVLSQLLQEKDQLQREQEDRIRNLTKLLVTSSNLVPVKKMPKRRVTWGGKMLRVGRSSACSDGPSDLSFAEPFSRKRKADGSCLMDLTEDDEDFECQWEVPDEPSDEMEMSQSSVTVRSFGDSPKDFVSLDRIHELSEKVSLLELQLEIESQQKEKAMARLETLDERVAELQLQLQTEGQKKQEALEKTQVTEQRAAELDLQLQTEAQKKQEALEKILITEERTAELELQLQTEAQQKLEALEVVEMLKIRVAGLERRLEEESRPETETEQIRKEFADTIQLCETLVSEKDMVAAERDYLKQELGMFIEQTESLEKEKATLSQELEEKRETEEFRTLEEQFRTEYENELKSEISNLKKVIESSELQCQQLQNKLETVSEELKMKTEFAEELQCMSGKDLVQEVKKLRRSLDDAVCVSRDTKKEWAVLRSQNIALGEINATLTANHEKIEAEVNSLRSQLETEKSHSQKMQSDLQKELNIAFDENTKLTALLDGKVPKNLIDSVELESAVASLNKELAASRETEGALRAQLEELASLQTLPGEVDNLMKQICELTEELCTAQTHRDGLLSAQAECQEEAQQLRGSLQMSQDAIHKLQADLSAATQREKELRKQCTDLMQNLDSLHSDLKQSDGERSQLMTTIEETGLKLNHLTEEFQRVQDEKDALQSKQNVGAQSSAEEIEKLLSVVTALTAERDQLKMDQQQSVEMVAGTVLLQTLQDEIQEQKQNHSHVVDLFKQKESYLSKQILSLSQELQRVQDEKKTLVMASAQGSAEDMEKLLATVASLSAERDQLRMDLQENVEMMIENQEELRTVLEKNRNQKERIKQLEAASKQDGAPIETRAQLEVLQMQIQSLTEELESVRTERDHLLSEKEARCQTSTERLEELQQRVTSLSEERDQLQEMLEDLRQEKTQVKTGLEDRMGTLLTEIQQLKEHLKKAREEMIENQEELRGSQDKVGALQDEITMLMRQKAELESRLSSGIDADSPVQKELQNQIHSLTEELERVQAERDNLLFERTANTQTSTEQLEELQHRVTSLSEERDQLREILEGLKQEKTQLKTELEDRMGTLLAEMQTVSEKLECVQTERDHLSEKEARCQTSTEQLEELQQRVTSLSEERDQLQEILEGLRQEKTQLKTELEDRMGILLTEIQQLKEHLNKAREEVSQLKSDLQENIELMIENQEELRGSQDKVGALQDEISMLMRQKAELESRLSSGIDADSPVQKELQNQIHSLTEELERVQAERDNLLFERTANTQTSTEQLEELQHRVTSLSEERDQLHEILEGLKQEKTQVKTELEDRMGTLLAEMQTVTEKLECVQTERDHLLSEKEARCQTSTEQLEELQQRVTSLSEERDQLQEMLEGLRQEKTQLKTELGNRMDMISVIQGKLREQEHMNMQQQSEKEQKAKLQQELLSEANATIAALKEKLHNLNQSSTGVKETVSERLQDSTVHLEESFRKFQDFINTCSKYSSEPQDKILTLQGFLKIDYIRPLPKPTVKACSSLCQLGLQIAQSLTMPLQLQAGALRNLFKELVERDIAVFEERRLQDVLLCRAQAPSCSVKDEDFRKLWEPRITELLYKRQSYLQKMAIILEKLWGYMACYHTEHSAEIREGARFQEQLQAMFSTQPVSISRLDSILTSELDRRSAVVHSKKMTLQHITDELNDLFEELRLLDIQTYSQLREERSKSSTLLKVLEGAPLKTELSLLKDNQQLVLQVQQAEEKVKALCVQNRQLEEAQIKADDMVSNHKQATQLLQTELQDSRALVQEKENTIQTLKHKLQESEKNVSPSSVELENLQTKLLNMEVELHYSTDKHQQEIQRMTTVLKVKEDSLRKLKETLRKSQHQVEESFMQGKDLHGRLTNPRSLLMKSSIQLEKTKLEEEVRHLQLKVTELESLVSGEQAESSKWKNRAIKLKSKAEMDKPSSPDTSTKRPLPMTSDSSSLFSSPKKILLSPTRLLENSKVSLLDSPKSRFFDGSGNSELLSRTCPQQFFDNSSLGTIPGADQEKGWWPSSPKKEDLCKTQ